ncbi:MAG: protein-disulfide reductase DsbD domain-containing protein [Terracidiphilus sp.]
MKSILLIAACAVLILASTLAHGQRPLIDGLERPAAKPAAVEYLYPEQINLPAGKPVKVTLHFRVTPGLHINSHKPTDFELIPATFTIPPGSGVELISIVYPPGAEFALPLAPTTKLSVYSGAFTLQASLKAAPGNHLVEATLRYQACDNNACMPPKTIPVVIDVTGR